MTKYNYDRSRFDPPAVYRPKSDRHVSAGDDRESPPYVYSEPIILAVNVALVTGRPILVRGKSGTGKSSLAKNVAHFLGWRYYESVITSRTQARDLLYEVDLVRRLHAAQAAAVRPDATEFADDFAPYVVPKALFWAFDRARAQWRGADADSPSVQPVRDPAPKELARERAVVLIDEIDKADPDVPNNLLVPLGSLLFRIEETNKIIAVEREQAPLVLLTTNEERRLPDAFLRRCVELTMPSTTRARLVEIGRAHFANRSERELRALLEGILGSEPVDPVAQAEEELWLSPAEFIDTLNAGEGLSITPEMATEWQALVGATAKKPQARELGT